MLHSEPFFSVIVPMYNMEQYIDECLSSILGQQFKSVELIVVDDGSTDRTVEKCFSLMDLGYEYKLLGQHQGGPNIARNLALQHATGSYVLFMDADDRLNTGALQILHDEIVRLPKADVISFGYRFFDDETGVTRLENCPIRRDLRGEDIFIESLVGKDFASVCWNKCYQRTLLIGNDISFIPDKVHGRDLLFSRTVAMHAREWHALNVIIYESRFRAGSFSRNFSESNIKSAINAVQYHIKLFHEVSVSRGILPELNYAMYRHLRYIILLAAFRIKHYRDFKCLFIVVKDSSLWHPSSFFFSRVQVGVINRLISLVVLHPLLCWAVSRLLKRMNYEPY